MPLQRHGSVEVLVYLVEEPFRLRMVVVDGLTTEAILGMDFLEFQCCVTDAKQRTLSIASCNIQVPMVPYSQPCSPVFGAVSMLETRQIPPYSEIEALVSVLV